MIKYEINKLHKTAQIGKEYCEHIMRYVTDQRLMDTIHRQRQVYNEQMQKLEKIYYGLSDISPAKSIWFSWMMKSELLLCHNTDKLIKVLLRGNYMGVRALADFIQCPFNSEESKVYARDMLQAINTNIEQLMSEYLYQEDILVDEY